MSRIVLAMSGGVDSSVAAHLLKWDGHDVIGVFMRNTGASPLARREIEGPAPLSDAAGLVADHQRRGCGNAADAEDARRVAERLGIPLHVVDFDREFDRIIDYFVSEYMVARTPNPCIVCNIRVKFGKLFEFADRAGAEYVATGHHARLVRSGERTESGSGGNGFPALCRGVDRTKDQSYVLFGIDRRRLPRIMLPIGGHDKSTVRSAARALGLGVADKRDSQDLCFVTSGRYHDLVQARGGGQDTSGEIVDTTGRIVGHHDGIERFTIGQRKGLGVAAGQRRFVVRIEAKTRCVVIGTKDELAARVVTARQVNWLVDLDPTPHRCTAQIRYGSTALPATVVAGPGDQLRVVFDEPCHGVAPGQAVVCYDGPRVLGGGWIDTWSPAVSAADHPL